MIHYIQLYYYAQSTVSVTSSARVRLLSYEQIKHQQNTHGVQTWVQMPVADTYGCYELVMERTQDTKGHSPCTEYSMGSGHP